MVVIPIASGALFHKVGQGFGELRSLGLVDGTAPRLFGGQAEGCEPVATAFRDGRRVTPVRPDTIARSLAIGNPADGDFAVATARATRRRDLRRRRGRRSARTWRSSRRRRASSARRRPASRSARSGRRSTPASVGRDDRVVLLVTGDGLKTPGPVAHTYDPVTIEADADAFIDDVLVAA